MFCVFFSVCIFICNLFVLGYANIELLIQLFKLNIFLFPYKRIVIEYSFLNSNAKILQMKIYFSIQMQNICKLLLSVFLKNLQSGSNKMQLHDKDLYSKIYFPRQLQKLCTIFLGNVLIWTFFPWNVLFRNVNSGFRLDFNMKQKNQCSLINSYPYFCWIFIDIIEFLWILVPQEHPGKPKLHGQ